LTIEYLEAIASIRCYFHEVAKVFNSICGEHHSLVNDAEHELIDKVKMLCTNQSMNKTIDSVITGPGIYLIRLLVRKYGFSTLIKLSKIFKWVVPEELSSPDQVRKQYLMMTTILIYTCLM